MINMMITVVAVGLWKNVKNRINRINDMAVNL